ncbi:zf-HC2 domain-containing protein [Desulfoscipio sp. XC116]|uniref:zf-HC2 domain-containing protein n=1 Tax=Desulfoscipio sp. XC116 TaxID=3144975 RepID=UPI00325B1363
MCYEEGILQAYMDCELSSEQRREITRHLGQCAKCRSVLEELKSNNLFVEFCMEQCLADMPDNCTAAKVRLNNDRLSTRLRNIISKRLERSLNAMKFYKKTMATAAMAAILFTAFSFPAVRSMAGEFLTVFRMEKVQTINVSPGEIRQLEKAVSEGAGNVNIENFGKVEVSGKQETIPVTLAQAADAVDFAVKLPQPAGYEGPDLQKVTGSTANLTLDVANVNSLLQALGSTKLLPESLDGQTFTMHMPTAIVANYRSDSDKLMVIQARSPEMKAPAGVDVLSIRDALLNVPALPENLRSQLLAVDDWQHTILIPNMDGTSKDVIVNGTQGVFMDGSDQADNSMAMSFLIWQKSGVIYTLSGTNLNEESAVAIAGQMK